MKKMSWVGVLLLSISSLGFAQYKGKYVNWSTGYLFTGSLNARHYKAFTHIMDFGPKVGSGSTVSGGRGSSFVNACHANGVKALICFGGQGNSSANSAACATAAGRTKLVNNMIKAALAGGYDGIDMDWEPGEQNGFDGTPAKVEMFRAFHKELRDSIDARTPRLIFTAAVVFDWYPNCSAAIAPYVDQANSMTYYDPVTKMPELLGDAALKGTPHSKVGVGFGWDTDNEVRDTKDILAKCSYAIDNGFGGIMGWHITAAGTDVLDGIATYVTHTPATYVLPSAEERKARANALIANYDGMKRLREISYIVPRTPSNSALVDLRMFNLNGALVKILVHGNSSSGNFTIPMDNGAIGPGAYIVKLSAGSTTEAVTARIVP
jgi:hypothetical protein